VRCAACLALLVAACSHPPAKPGDSDVPATRTAPYNDSMDRGYLLAAYDQAAFKATDAVLALHPPQAKRRYIAVQNGGRWVVRFGELDAERENFVVSYEAKQDRDGSYTAKAIDPPWQERGFTASAARAVETALQGLRSKDGVSFNYAVLPQPDGTLYVYFYPSTKKVEEAFMGPDLRLTMSADGNKVVESHQPHTRPIRFEMEKDGTIFVNEFGVPHYFTEAEMAEVRSRKR
jgi:hypothetical protein